MTAPLTAFLASVFGRAGLLLHGETEVRKRKDLVRQFQEDERVPFFVLSVKAGGTGLNLTAASHVIHFDRWWNPAVENQATDRRLQNRTEQECARAQVHLPRHRGGQDRPDDRVQETTGRRPSGRRRRHVLTEMKDAELLDLVTLDLAAAMKEG
jgi:non-specific serine/threonine protein kinase